MEMKRVFGLDLGTNSVGWSSILLPKHYSSYGEMGSIEGVGSRIVPFDGDYLQKFQSGLPAQTKAEGRRIKRASRRLKHRYKLRRTRLVKVFKELGWLDGTFPEDFKKSMRDSVDFKFQIADHLPFSDDTIAEFEKAHGIYGKKSKNGRPILPEDWVIYFLRKKALTEKISFQELARIIYMFNQRRGFKSSRKDLKSGNVEEVKWVERVKISSVEQEGDEKTKGKYKFTITAYSDSNRVQPWTELRKAKPDWVGKEFTLLITEKTENGKTKQLKPQLPKEGDWDLCVTALDQQIKATGDHPGTYFCNGLLGDRNFRIRQYAVHRWRYERELKAIWEAQLRLNPELRELNENVELRRRLAELLYPSQVKAGKEKLKEFLNNDLLHIISSDIIYYQRELKSQKGSIGECPYEKRMGRDGLLYGLKRIPRSSPDFQEFRIWQDIHSIRLIEREQVVDGVSKLDIEVTDDLMTTAVKEELFELFNERTFLNEVHILGVVQKHFPSVIIEAHGGWSHRVNLFANRKELKGHETKAMFRGMLRKAGIESESLLGDYLTLYGLWHIAYSTTSSDLEKSERGMTTGLNRLLSPFVDAGTVSVSQLAAFVSAMKEMPELEKRYGAYSAKAVKKLLLLMRCGKFWRDPEEVSAELLEDMDASRKVSKAKTLKKLKGEADDVKEVSDRISTILTEGWDLSYDRRTGEYLKRRDFEERGSFSGLPTWMACYVAYGRHSEREDTRKLNDWTEFDVMKLLPYNCIPNPIVEQMVREAMLVVRDMWRQFGQPDEIHVEMGRDLLKNREERKKISERQGGNFQEKQRIRKLLKELLNETFEEYNEEERKVSSNFTVKPNPDSPVDVEKFRIWKEGSEQFDDRFEKLFKSGNKERNPTLSEIKTYTLWLTQGCRSPYTGRIIPLSKLFDETAYQKEHIIPRSLMKNDSMSNLVIAEAAINPPPYKGRKLARNFIKDFGGQTLKIGNENYPILDELTYEEHCKKVFARQRGKLKNLLATEVPKGFSERQMNDTRYISRMVASLLANVTKDENGILFTSGAITSELKGNWGLNKVWKQLVRPRFERLGEIMHNNREHYIHVNKRDRNDIDLQVDENPKLELKRIDHRHHAMDALVIAATTREHVRYLNTLNAVDSDEELKAVKRSLVKGKIRDFKTPWDEFTLHAKTALQTMIVSTKNNPRIVSKPSNRISKWKKSDDGIWSKKLLPQKDNPRWMAVRRSMFKEPQGILYIKEVYEETNIMKAIQMQLNRMRVQDTPDMKVASYIYDKEARTIVKLLIKQTGFAFDEEEAIVKELKKRIKKQPLTDGRGIPYQSIRVARFVEYAGKRVSLDATFDHTKINKIPYSSSSRIPLLLHEHLHSYHMDKSGLDLQECIATGVQKNQLVKEAAKEAFSSEGMEALAKKNGGKRITKVTIKEKKSPDSRFKNYYVEGDAGSNAHYLIHIKGNKRAFELVQVHKAVERLSKGKSLYEPREDCHTVMLSPGDLVYVPTAEQLEGKTKIDWGDQKAIASRSYLMTRCPEQSKCFFLHSTVASLLIDYDAKSKKGEFGSQNTSQQSLDNLDIKSVCVKVKVNRLGSVVWFDKKSVPAMA